MHMAWWLEMRIRRGFSLFVSSVPQTILDRERETSLNYLGSLKDHKVIWETSYFNQLKKFLYLLAKRPLLLSPASMAYLMPCLIPQDLLRHAAINLVLSTC